MAKVANMQHYQPGLTRMKTLTAKDAKYGFGNLIDLARAEPVAVTKHGRPVVVVLSFETFERLNSLKTTERPATLKRMSNKVK